MLHLGPEPCPRCCTSALNPAPAALDCRYGRKLEHPDWPLVSIDMSGKALLPMELLECVITPERAGGRGFRS